jgi:nucleotide-binding universal stress UspA family protein
MTPAKKILFAADFSATSIDAFRVTCSLAAHDGSLVIVHVIDTDRLTESSQNTESLEATCEGRMRDTYIPERPLEVVFRVLKGPVAATILRASEELQVDMIAIGTHARTRLRRILTGSVAASILREARCPVIALHCSDGRHLPPQIRVVMSATAISPESGFTLRAARSLAAAFAARLVILHVSPRGVLMDGSLSPRIGMEYYHDFAAQLQKDAEGSGLSRPPEIRITWGNVTEQILSEADEIGCDLIVMGTNDGSRSLRALIGSVPQTVMHRAHCPVLLVRGIPRDDIECAR